MHRHQSLRIVVRDVCTCLPESLGISTPGVFRAVDLSTIRVLRGPFDLLCARVYTECAVI
jgi:hypothetical protein